MRLFVRPMSPGTLATAARWGGRLGSSATALPRVPEVRRRCMISPERALTFHEHRPARAGQHCLAMRVDSEHRTNRRAPFGRGTGINLDRPHRARSIRRRGPIDVVVIDQALLRGWVRDSPSWAFAGYAVTGASLTRPARCHAVLFEDERTWCARRSVARRRTGRLQNR
jgi:hypothetical protein